MIEPEDQSAGRNRKPVIGICGGIGSGKSFVANLFARQGCHVIDADRIAREATANPAIEAAITARFGPDARRPDGALDRAAIGKRVFADERELAWLESWIHPVVREQRHRQRAAAQRDPDVVAIVEDVPLLLENGIDREVDVVVFVDADEPTRHERTRLGRGWTPEQHARRESRQIPLDSKARRADYVIENSNRESADSARVHRILSQILGES